MRKAKMVKDAADRAKADRDATDRAKADRDVADRVAKIEVEMAKIGQIKADLRGLNEKMAARDAAVRQVAKGAAVKVKAVKIAEVRGAEVRQVAKIAADKAAKGGADADSWQDHPVLSTMVWGRRVSASRVWNPLSCHDISTNKALNP